MSQPLRPNPVSDFFDDAAAGLDLSYHEPPKEPAFTAAHVQGPDKIESFTFDPNDRRFKMMFGKPMNTAESFSCILLSENAFNVSPDQLLNVMAVSSNNSLFIASSLLSDPASPPRRLKVRHVMGNVGKPGTVLLVPPIQPRIMNVGIESWRLINHDAWDGMPRDSFQDSSLHLSFTGAMQEVDIGYSGAQDKELYILESVFSLFAKGSWIADLDVLKPLQHPPYIYRNTTTKPNGAVPGSPDQVNTTGASETAGVCLQSHHERKYKHEEFPIAAIENWWELLEKANESCIFLAHGNWQARLAAMMILIAQGRRVWLLPDGPLCWTCIAGERAEHTSFQ